jgi:hypothetical protein
LQAQGPGDADGKARRSTKGSSGKAAGLQARKSSRREAGSGKLPITAAAAAGQASLQGSQGAAVSAKDAGGNPEDAAIVTSEPQWLRRRRSASAEEEAAVKDSTSTRTRRRSASAGAASLQAESEPDGGTSKPKRGGRRQRQLEAIAAGMLEKDAQDQGSAEAKGKASPVKRIRLPSFKDLDALREERMAGKLPHMDLTQEEGRYIAAHLLAFSKSAKMRDSARALYINTEVSNHAPCDLLILHFRLVV